MLLERATSLAGKIVRYQKLKSAAVEAERFRTRAGQIQNAATLVLEAAAALQRFAAAGIAVPFEPANAGTLVERAQVLRDLAANDPAGLAEPPFQFKYEFVDRLAGITTAADQAIKQAWAAHVGAVAPGGSEELLDALNRLPQLRPAVTRVRRCRADVAALAAAVPPDPARALADLDRLVAEHSAAMKDLRSDDMPPAVTRLIAAAGEPRGAPIAWLTDEARAWLEARGLADSFRVRLV